MARLVFSLLAASDLDGIQAYVARNNPHAALRLADRIEETCRRLAGRPLIGRERPELAPGLRSMPVGRYVIFYRPIPDGIEIARVLHGARDVGSAFKA